jgi:hypothetical protein
VEGLMTSDPRQRLQAYANQGGTVGCCVSNESCVPEPFAALEAVWEVVTNAEHYGAPIFGDDIRDAILDNIPEVTP